MPTLYKLTDKDGITGAVYDAPVQWAPGVTHEIPEVAREVQLGCAGVIHAYESPLVAAFMNPAHANYDPARMWRCETDGKIIRDGELKCGTHKLTCVEEMPLPEITTTQRVRVAILCALEVCDDPEWRAWGQRWLSGECRNPSSAASAAKWAANAAEARASVSAVDLADGKAAWSAINAAWAAERAEGHSLNFHEIIEQAMREEQ